MSRPRRLVAGAALVMLGLGAVPTTAQAGVVPSCTATADPADIVIDLNDPNSQSQSFTFDITFAGNWPDLDGGGEGTYIRLTVQKGSTSVGPVDGPGLLPLDLFQQAGALPASVLVDALGQVLEVPADEVETGSYTLTYAFLNQVPGDDACALEWTITFVAEGDTLPVDDLPETGTATATMWAWATALLGAGAVSALAASRRRA